MTPRDLKSYGLPKSGPDMPDWAWNFCLGLVALIFLLAVYGLVVDEDDRMVVMSRAKFEQRIAQERIDAARKMAQVAPPKACTWKDMFVMPVQPGREGK